MEEYQLKEIIGKERLNYTNLKTVLDYFIENPGANASKAAVDTGMGSNIYRYRDLLIQYKILNKHNIHKGTNPDRISNYVFPKDVIEGNNSINNPMVNLASLLARFDDNDLIPGFTTTKREILERISKNSIEKEDVKKAIDNLKNDMMGTLAVIALVANNLTAFTNMTNTHPVTELDIKKTGLL